MHSRMTHRVSSSMLESTASTESDEMGMGELTGEFIKDGPLSDVVVPSVDFSVSRIWAYNLGRGVLGTIVIVWLKPR